MTEVLGVVASSIAIGGLAAKVAKSIVKLQDCWEQVQDAPADILTLLRQIECFEALISQIQTGPRIPDIVFDNSCLNRSLSLCEAGISELADLVNELDRNIRDKGGWRKKLGGVKVVLKKNELKRAKSRMKSAISILSLAHQSYAVTMTQLQNEIIVARLVQHFQSTGANQNLLDIRIVFIRSNEDETSDLKTQVTRQVTRQFDTWTKFLLGSFKYLSCDLLQNGEPRRDYTAKYSLPDWVCQGAFHVQGHEFLSQWTVNCRFYRIMPSDSPLFEAVRDGDASTVVRMIDYGSASVSDREDGSGDTVLHMAVQAGHVEMCRLLLSLGADPTQTNIHDRTPLDVLLSSAAELAFHQQKQPLDILRLLFSSNASNQIFENNDRVWFSGGPIAMFKYILNEMYPPYYQRDFFERMSWASHICQRSGGYSNGPKLVNLALSLDGSITPEMAAWKDAPNGRTMLHSLVVALARSTQTETTALDGDLGRAYRELVEAQPTRSFGYGITFRDCTKMWTPLIQGFLKNGAIIHALDFKLRTPLWHLFSHLHIGDVKVICERRIPNLLVTWVTALYECGADLQQYGSRERELDTFLIPQDSHLYQHLVVGIVCGPRPSNWHLVLQDHR